MDSKTILICGDVPSLHMEEAIKAVRNTFHKENVELIVHPLSLGLEDSFKPKFNYITVKHLEAIIKTLFPNADYYQKGERSLSRRSFNNILLSAAAGYHKKRGYSISYNNRTKELKVSSNITDIKQDIQQIINKIILG